ncbi:MAG: hypothetical protein M3O67_05800, partial [Bacteroidota bacterium]|nr:hypothetical protein [Bacteroidota bacterium]
MNHKQLVTIVLSCPAFFGIIALNAQGNSKATVKDCKPIKSRELFHDYVDKEQKNLLKSDGKDDNVFTVSLNEEVNFLVTQSLINKIDVLQCKIEKDSVMGGQTKIGYIRGIERMLKYIGSNWKSKRLHASNLPIIVEAYDKIMRKDANGESIEDILETYPYEVGNAVLKSEAFNKNAGYKNSKNLLIRKYCAFYPEQTFQTLNRNSDVPFLDSLIRIAAYKYPRQLYDYASANNKLGYAIRKIDDDPLIRAVSKMATSSSGQWYFPFLDNIVKGKMNFEEIDAVKKDSIKYYKLLVKTHLDYVARALNKDTAFEFAALADKLEKKAVSVFVNVINGLHDVDNPAIRFKIIQLLTAEELYYLAVMSDGIIYTSSYTKGVYPLMMSRIGQRGDSLLMAVQFDKYRKFIKMAAGYNTLSNFLNSFHNKDNAEKLMQAFVSGIEKTTTLEDGVDVADSYASIAETIKPLANEMLNNVKLNYDRTVAQNNKKGMVMYNLLYKLFLSADTTNNIDLSKEFGIPPVYGVKYNVLANEKDQVVMQVFFYGDKDGQNIFQGFLRQFGNSNWKTTMAEKWVTISSTKGKSVAIYANRPLPEEGGEDEKAQEALDDYLLKNNLKPTVVIHRGHSYYAPYTISQILPSAKIVFMGSCGGYHLIHDILENAPDAHII